ncbi:MinD/ParA family ATP-binding protein [Caldanaerobacter subterraneus]|uniref:ATPase involved in chromosome partitioning n=1 Tax=Caldanaerobacter subterraneus subsp. pacificus DSM 12653 TaxID=391606 RepID=B7R850_9THEO|nr:AAA family ATPase [Caldanaerobacter subterraneus]KKC29620.1 ATPase involved in chromosome partitioning [Caldanaerobacter subterraneus subsp. pacificus DSM 12653]
MMDQAESLRRLVSQKKGIKKSRVITISGGKGGIGKTCISVNLSLALKKLGYNVTIIDADLGFSNVEIELGVTSKYTLFDVLYNNKMITEVISEGPLGVKYISSGGDFTLIDEGVDLTLFLSNIKILDYYSDFIIIDTGAGLNKVVHQFLQAADEIVLIVTPEPTSIMDAYTLIKHSLVGEKKKINVLINKVKNFEEYRKIYKRFETVVNNYLGVSLNDLGYLEIDEKMTECIIEQTPIVIKYHNGKTAKQLIQIAAKLANQSPPEEPQGLWGIFTKLLKQR